MERKPVGRVIHFYPRVSVAVVELSDELKVGDMVSIEGPNGKVEQMVSSMQIEHQAVSAAGPGQSVGLKVDGRVREKDVVYKLSHPAE